MNGSPVKSESLESSRARISQWLEQDQSNPNASPLSEAVRDTLPFLSAVWGHPATAMLLGAVAKSFYRTGDGVSPANNESASLNFAVDQVRQHPKTAVLAVGLVGIVAAYWLSRKRQTTSSD